MKINTNILYSIFAFALLGLLCYPAESFAILFDVVPTDKSQEYLGGLFGARVGTIALGGGANRVLPQIFEAMNTVIVFLGVIVVGYVGFTSTMNTAYEGEVLGKKLSTFWMPVRAALGILLMIPTPNSGYSLIQTGVIWIVLQGVGAANQLWNVVLDGVAQGFSPQGGIILNDSDQQSLEDRADKLISAILASTVCIEGSKKLSEVTALGFIPSNSPFAVLTDETPSSYLSEHAFRVKLYAGRIKDRSPASDEDTIILEEKYFGGEKNNRTYEKVCGEFKIQGVANEDNTVEGQDKRQVSQEHLFTMVVAFNSLYQLMLPTAKSIIANTDILEKSLDELQEPLNSNVPAVKNLIDKIGFAKTEYINTMSALATPSATSSDRINVINNAKRVGWIHAGALYFFLGDGGGDLELSDDAKKYPQPITNTIPTVENINRNSFTLSAQMGRDPGDAVNSSQAFLLMEKYLNYTQALLEGASGTNPKETNPLAQSTGNVGGAVAKIAAKIIGIDRDALSKGGDPLIALKNHGNTIMAVAEGAWLATVGISMGVALAASIGSGVSPGGYISDTVGTILFGIFVGAIMMFWTTGAMLAIYLPMIPFMMFTISAMGWMVAVIEAMIAAPILALGLTTPAGDELGKATAGIGLLANIFLRPVLMIFGFILAARLLQAAITYITVGISEVLFTQTGDGLMWIFAFIVKLGIYSGIIISITNKVFSLIHILPDKVLRWMGGPTESGFGEESVLQEAKGKFEGAANQSGQALGGGAQAGAAGGNAARKQLADGKK